MLSDYILKKLQIIMGCKFLTALIFTALISLCFLGTGYAEIELEEAKDLADRFLTHLKNDDYKTCYTMLSPLTKKSVSQENFTNLLQTMEEKFGTFISVTYDWNEFGWHLTPEDGSQYRMIALYYKGGTKGNTDDSAVRIDIISLEGKLWINSYYVFPHAAQVKYKLKTQDISK